MRVTKLVRLAIAAGALILAVGAVSGGVALAGQGGQSSQQGGNGGNRNGNGVGGGNGNCGQNSGNGNNNGHDNGFGNGNGQGCGYPPPAIATSCSFAQTLDVGTSATVNVTCTFKPMSTITIAFDGSNYSTATAPPSGIFVEQINATSPHNVSLNGGPSMSVTFGAVNTFVATGSDPGGETNTATTNVIVFPA